MSPFITISPISDETQNGLPARMLVNAMHIFDVRPVIGVAPVPVDAAPLGRPGDRVIEDPAADAPSNAHPNEIGSIVSWPGHNVRVSEAPDVILGMMGDRPIPAKGPPPAPVTGEQTTVGQAALDKAAAAQQAADDQSREQDENADS